jgi:hypothetical protein
MGLKGQNWSRFGAWCQRGRKIRPKQVMDQLPLENFENSRIELLVCQKSLIVSFIKSWPLVGKMVDYGKKGEFLKYLINFSWNTSLYVSTSEFDLEIGNWVWFAKTNQVVAKNDPYMPNLNQNNLEFLFELISHLFYLLCVVLP